MIMLKEPIAREANIEDGVSGHFFGERFWCRRCWTIEEVTQAMLFTHTNPVRAGLAETPETAEFSSYQDRLEDQRAEGLGGDVSGGADEPRTAIEMESSGLFELQRPQDSRSDAQRRADFLAPLRLEGVGYDAAGAGRRLTNDGYLNITLNDYRDVIAVCRNKGGEEALGTSAEGDHEGESVEGDWRRWRESMPAEMPAELERLGFDRARWAESYRRNARRFDRLTRKADELRRDFQQRL